ncbi:hypothetical protein TrRE_jg298, partial [Triparma retinervis]
GETAEEHEAYRVRIYNGADARNRRLYEAEQPGAQPFGQRQKTQMPPPKTAALTSEGQRHLALAHQKEQSDYQHAHKGERSRLGETAEEHEANRVRIYNGADARNRRLYEAEQPGAQPFGQRQKTQMPGGTGLAEGGTVDHDFLAPEHQRLGAYHVDRGNNVYYKGERLGIGPFKDIGDGWASGGGGTLYFHGQEVELSSLMQAVVLRGQFYNAGNGYGIAEGGRVFYSGKEVDIGPITGHQTELDHLGDGWSRTSKNVYLVRGKVVSELTARKRCPYFAEFGEAAVKAEGGTVDHDFLKPEAQRLGAYHVDRGNNVYYKGEMLGIGPFKDIGDGWASGGGGTLYFHGQEVELSTFVQGAVLRGQFHNAGNGYGIAEGGRVFYSGKEVDIGPITGHQTELEHLGDGWSRTSKNVYLVRGKVVSELAARKRCPYFAEYGEPAKTH